MFIRVDFRYLILYIIEIGFYFSFVFIFLSTMREVYDS